MRLSAKEPCMPAKNILTLASASCLQAWNEHIASVMLASGLLSGGFWQSRFPCLSPAPSNHAESQTQSAPSPDVPEAHDTRQPNWQSGLACLQLLLAVLQLGHGILPRQAGGAAPEAAASGAAAHVLQQSPMSGAGSLSQATPQTGSSYQPQSSIVQQLAADLRALCDLVVGCVRSRFLRQPASEMQLCIQVRISAADRLPMSLEAWIWLQIED